MKTLLTIMAVITVLPGTTTLCMHNEEKETLNQSYSWTNQKLELRAVPSDKIYNGLGIFTREKIDKNERLVVFGGAVITEQKVLALSRANDVLQIDDDLWLSCDIRQDTDRIRHSCSPNTGFKTPIMLIAMRDIDADEEITIDYAMVVERFVGMNDFPCRCNAENCRKIVAGTDWKNKYLQNKYRGYFSPYLQEKINKLS
jgi:hypothetical protein